MQFHEIISTLKFIFHNSNENFFVITIQILTLDLEKIILSKILHHIMRCPNQIFFLFQIFCINHKNNL